MTTMAVIGAGPGLGVRAARRFGQEGFDVALISRTQQHLDDLAEELADDGIHARGFAADVGDRDALAAALASAADDLGPVEVLVYCPAVAPEFLRPVLETTHDELAHALDFSVHGPLAAVHAVLPGMRSSGRGTILFVNGGTAVHPRADFAGTSMAFAAESALVAMLHDTLADDGVHVGQLIIPGAIEEDHPDKDPAALADTLWQMHTDRSDPRRVATPMDTH